MSLAPIGLASMAECRSNWTGQLNCIYHSWSWCFASTDILLSSLLCQKRICVYLGVALSLTPIL